MFWSPRFSTPGAHPPRPSPFSRWQEAVLVSVLCDISQRLKSISTTSSRQRFATLGPTPVLPSLDYHCDSPLAVVETRWWEATKRLSSEPVPKTCCARFSRPRSRLSHRLTRLDESLSTSHLLSVFKTLMRPISRNTVFIPMTSTVSSRFSKRQYSIYAGVNKIHCAGSPIVSTTFDQTLVLMSFDRTMSGGR